MSLRRMMNARNLLSPHAPEAANASNFGSRLIKVNTTRSPEVMFVMATAQPEAPSRILSDSEVEALREDGVICAPKVLPKAWVDRIAIGIEAAQSAPSALGEILSMRNRGFSADLFMWLQNDEFKHIVFNSPLARLAQQVLDSPTVTHWYDQLFLKEPGSDVPTPWPNHQYLDTHRQRYFRIKRFGVHQRVSHMVKPLQSHYP